MEFSKGYILGFALALCLVCSAVVSFAAVGLKDMQDANKLLDRRINVLKVAGVIAGDAHPAPDEVNHYFEPGGGVSYEVVDRTTGEVVTDLSKVGVASAEEFDPIAFAKEHLKDDALVAAVPKDLKKTQVKGLPRYLQVIAVKTDEVDCYVLPIHGYGLWSILYGYLAVAHDGSQVVGITYYEHGETPGLGGEVDNPNWKAQWPGQRIYGDDGSMILEVKKHGQVTDPSHQVDGMSGATITTNGVNSMIQLWLGDEGYGTFLKAQRTNS
ncbi:MAG: NADH:ubiquinone reductase (Na(+)-transporting) subunit C [Planctomycetota bacterium]